MKQFKLTTPCIAALLTLHLWAVTNLASIVDPALDLPPIAFKADTTHCATNGTLVMQGHCALTFYKHVIHADQINVGGFDHAQFLYATGNVRVVVNEWRGEGNLPKFIGIATCSEAEMTHRREITLRGTPVCLTGERGACLEAPVIHLEELASGMRITFETNVTIDVSDLLRPNTTRTSRNANVPADVLDAGTNCARVAADRIVYDRANDTTWFAGNCVLMLSDYTLYAGTMRIMGSQYIDVERGLNVYASNGVRVCIAPQSATGVVVMAVGAEAKIEMDGIKLTGSPWPVLRSGGTYLRAKRITYTTRTGAWKFDPASEMSTEPPQDMRELFIMPTNAPPVRRRPLRNSRATR